MPVGEYLAQFVRSIPAGSAPAGIAFNLGGDVTNGRLSSHSVIAPSVLVPNGLYVQVNAAYEGRLTVTDIRDRFNEMIMSSLQGLNLSLREAEMPSA